MGMATVALLGAVALAACGQASGGSPSAPTPAASPIQAFVAVVQPAGSACVEVGDPQVSWITAETSQMKVGQDLAVSLVVPEVDVTDVFPWQSPRSSDPGILVSAAPCSDAPAVSSLPVKYFLFRAVAAGTATISALLTPAWSPLPCQSGVCTPLAPLTITVVVAP